MRSWKSYRKWPIPSNEVVEQASPLPNQLFPILKPCFYCIIKYPQIKNKYFEGMLWFSSRSLAWFSLWLLYSVWHWQKSFGDIQLLEQDSIFLRLGREGWKVGLWLDGAYNLGFTNVVPWSSQTFMMRLRDPWARSQSLEDAGICVDYLAIRLVFFIALMQSGLSFFIWIVWKTTYLKIPV